MQNYADLTETMQKTSLRSTVWAKVVKYVEKKSTTFLLKRAAEAIAGLILGAILVRPDIVINFFLEALKTQNYALPKVAGALLLVLCRKPIIRFFRRLGKKPQQEKLIDGIPALELADYLIRNKHFKREGVNGVRETFGLNMEKFNRLAGKLEENGVLVRGENNSRILEGKWSLQALVDYLGQADTSKQMKPWFRVTRVGEHAKVRFAQNEIGTC